MGSLTIPNEQSEVEQQKEQEATRPVNKRAMNRQSSRKMLESRNIEYFTNNDGIHLVVTGYSGLIDFWPGKGKWQARDGSMRGFGVANLIDLIECGQL
ncbi:hypothetical protein ACMXYR_05440 [Neptuniibacter sp. QD29_5]|uniref:hypothetical protein n=1 Tax=Neptuniibacter sp. QD29_5 TaxID=3398207 RepID=UPI0039F5FB7B